MSFGAASHVLLISKQSQLCLVLTLNLLNISVHRHCECADVGEAVLRNSLTELQVWLLVT